MLCASKILCCERSFEPTVGVVFRAAGVLAAAAVGAEDDGEVGGPAAGEAQPVLRAARGVHPRLLPGRQRQRPESAALQVHDGAQQHAFPVSWQQILQPNFYKTCQ